MIAFPDEAGITRLAGLPEGQDAFVLAELAEQAGVRGLLHVAEDPRRMELLCRQLRFVAPHLAVRQFPAWDCLPYERVSPSVRVTGRRIDALAALAADGPRSGPRVVLTTAAAARQLVPRVASVMRRGLRLTPDTPFDLPGLEAWLVRAGYAPAAELREFGDVRSDDDALDVLAPGTGGALRFEPGGALRLRRLGGDRDGEAVAEAVLLPVTEVVLDEDAIARFSNAYLAAIGSEAAADPLLANIAAGRRVPGMEQWLPLFEPDLAGLVEQMPEAVVAFDEEADAMAEVFCGQVARAFAARQAHQAAVRTGLPPWRPVPPDRLLVDAEGFQAGLAGRRVVRIQAGDEGPGETAAHLGGRPLAQPLPGATPAERLTHLGEHGGRLLVAADTPQQQAAAVRRLRRAGVERAAAVADWPAAERLAAGSVAVGVFPLETGCSAPGLVVVPAPDLFGEADAAPRRQRFSRLATALAREAAELAPGSLVVHRDHGIGLSDGLDTVDTGGAPRECLRLRFRGDTKLLVPVETLDLVSPYGLGDGAAALDALTGEAWPKRRRAVAEALLVQARALVQAQAERALYRTAPIRPDRAALRRFAAAFPHEETPDQRAAIRAVLEDMASGRLMDRLLCADVGFGKTEVALRAAAAVVLAGRQVAVMAPTTPLCRQHAEEFQARFAGMGVAVAELSRATAPADARALKKELTAGTVRLVVGTHALLGRDVAFADLGLMVVDEEQRLGVQQKERLKALGRTAHVLTLTATPIPRTLQLALAGLRDLSVITTPPPDRRPVRSHSLPFDPAPVAAALAAERARGGQSFYVCPRLEDLPRLRARLDTLAPGAAVIEAHGKLKPADLEAAVTGFWEGAADILLCTNIVENGLHLPNANTMIVHRADRFGLAQLHQLRGRVGRGGIQGACWFTYETDRPVTEDARRRLDLVARTDRLGGGFDLAAHDLALRGGGNLLGAEQSGRFEAVGVELYEEMLGQAIDAVRNGGPAEPPPVPRIALAEPAAVPERLVPDAALRLAVYRRLACLEDADERDDFAAWLSDSLGPLPAELETLIDVGHLKDLCRSAGVAQLDIGPNGALLGFDPQRAPASQDLARLSRQVPALKPRDDGRLFLPVEGAAPPAFRDRLRRVVRLLTERAAAVPPAAAGRRFPGPGFGCSGCR